MAQVKFISAEAAAALLENGQTLAVEGFIGSGVAEEIHAAVEARYRNEQVPREMTLVYAAGIGDSDSKGLNHYAQEGLLKRIIGGHWGLVPKFQPLVAENKVEGYNLPQGVLSQIFRDAAAKRPWHISSIGLETFVDPELSGGKLNEATTEDLIKKIEIEGKPYLAYKTIYPDVAILKGSLADENGNISFEEEPLLLEAISMAMATKNNGGKVIVQVREKVANGTIDPKMVAIPGVCVDYVVVAQEAANHKQTFATQFNQKFISAGIKRQTTTEVSPLTVRKVIARRAAQFLNPQTDHVVNYGIGMPEEVAHVLAEEGQEGPFIPTIEPGIFGGSPQGGLDFGCSVYPQSIIQQSDMFAFYDGGGIDIAYLGLAETDQYGNVNVSKFGPKVAGAGGFINITQTAQKVIFCGTFSARGVKYDLSEQGIKVTQEGKTMKFVDAVEQITFSGNYSRKQAQDIYYVTERAVFKLVAEGMLLTEIAPGIDLEQDILNQMGFQPLISPELTLMDPSIFKTDCMNLEFKKSK